MFHRILVATDFSGGAAQALDLGAELAEIFAVPLVVLHAYMGTVRYDATGPWPTHRADPDPQRAGLEAQLGACRVRAQDRHVRDVDVALVEGDPAETILRVARDRACDLIVIGPDGESGALDRIGSVAEKVVRAAPCPVLVAGRA